MFLDYALAAAESGWSVFPLVPNKKIPLTRNGHKDATQDKNQILKWSQQYPNANIGIATGAISKLVVLDVDIKNGARGIESAKSLKGLAPTSMVKTPSGGFHYFYYCDMPCKGAIGFRPGLDFKADGGYVVGPGSELNGRPYQWIDAETPIVSISQILLDEIYGHDKLSQIVNAIVPLWIESKRNALNLALCGYLVKAHWDLAEIKNLFTLIYDKAGDPEKQNRLKNLELTYKLFKEGKPVQGFRALEKSLPAEPLKKIVSLIESHQPEIIEPDWHIAAADFLSSEPQPTSWLIRDLWTDESVGFIGAEPKVGKTWLALEMAISIATGTSVLSNFAVEKTGNVLYVSEEGKSSTIHWRMHQLAAAKNLPVSLLTKLRLSILKRVQLDQEQWQKTILKYCENFSPVAIFIDPLVRTHSLNEDKAREMQPVLHFLRSLQTIHHASVILVHHYKKPSLLDQSRSGQRLRGSGDLYAWLDDAIYLSKARGSKIIEVETEHRDGTEGDPFIFSIQSDPVKNSASLLYQEGNADNVKAMELINEIEKLIADHPDGILRTDILKTIKARSQIVIEALQKLEEQGKIKQDTIQKKDKLGRLRDHVIWSKS